MCEPNDKHGHYAVEPLLKYLPVKDTRTFTVSVEPLCTEFDMSFLNATIKPMHSALTLILPQAIKIALNNEME